MPRERDATWSEYRRRIHETGSDGIGERLQAHLSATDQAGLSECAPEAGSVNGYKRCPTSSGCSGFVQRAVFPEDRQPEAEQQYIACTLWQSTSPGLGPAVSNLGPG